MIQSGSGLRRSRRYPTASSIRGIAIYESKKIIPVIDMDAWLLSTHQKGTEIWSVPASPPTDQPVHHDDGAARGERTKYPRRETQGAGKRVRGFFSALRRQISGKTGMALLHRSRRSFEGIRKTRPWKWLQRRLPGVASGGGVGGGGGVFQSITYDPDTNLVFVGTGDGGPWPEGLRQYQKGSGQPLYCFRGRGGMRTRANTSGTINSFQAIDGTTTAFSNSQSRICASTARTARSSCRQIRTGSSTSSTRTNGKVISAEPYVQVNWASEIDLKTGRPITVPKRSTARTKPSRLCQRPAAGHNWAPNVVRMQYGNDVASRPLPAADGTYAVAQNFVYNPAWPAIPGTARGEGRGDPAAAAPPSGRRFRIPARRSARTSAASSARCRRAGRYHDRTAIHGRVADCLSEGIVTQRKSARPWAAAASAAEPSRLRETLCFKA